MPYHGHLGSATDAYANCDDHSNCNDDAYDNNYAYSNDHAYGDAGPTDTHAHGNVDCYADSKL